ncbi:hypothetical protein [Lentzea sp. NPDC092896]|uniref:hypothetical protein n=1 Tax=Lentzea sp. NPDC092896 TaxID=3364127 RepID=UPI0037FD1C2B
MTAQVLGALSGPTSDMTAQGLVALRGARSARARESWSPMIMSADADNSRHEAWANSATCLRLKPVAAAVSLSNTTAPDVFSNAR